MSFNAFRGMKPFTQLMFSAFVILVSFLAFMFLSMVAAIPLFGIDAMLNPPNISNLNNPESIRLLKFYQVVQSLGLFIVPSLILAWLFQGNINEYLLMNKKMSPASVVFVFILIFLMLPLINFLGEWNNKMQFPEWLAGVEDWMKNAENQAEALTEAFLKVNNTGGLLFNLFMIAVLPAIGEELLFRGVIQRIITNWTRNQHWGIWISAVLFSALHIQFYGFIPRMLLGVMFGYLLVWSGTIWLPILAHFFNNAFAVLAMYLIDNNIINPGVENIGSTAESYYTAVVSTILAAILMWLIRRDNLKSEPGYFNI